MLPTKEKTIRRMPRIQGLTYLSLTFQREKTEQAKEDIYRHVTTQYTIQGFRLNRISLSLHQFSAYAQIPLNRVMYYINNVASNMNSMQDPSNIQDLMKSIITLSTTWAIQDKGMIMGQIELLSKAQGNKYKPFISSELNKAMKLSLESNKNIMEAYKSFFNSNQSTTNILNITQPKQDKDNNFISPDQALQLIRDNEQKALSTGISDSGALSLPNNHTNRANEELAEELFQEHRLVDFGGHNFGASVVEPLSQEAPIHSTSTATYHKAKRRSSHESFEARRGHEADNTDALPQ